MPVEIQNCEIKKSRYGDGYDLLLRNKSIIKMSGRRDINASSIISDHYLPPEEETLEIMLNKVQDLENNKRVTVTAKVTVVHDPVHLIEKKKQDVFLSDQSGSAKLVLWEADIGSLEAGKSYVMKNLVVRSYQCAKHLCKGDATEIETSADIGVVSIGTGDLEKTLTLKSPTIVGVPELETYKACLKCRSRVEPASSVLGNCTSCRMMQRYDICSEYTTAKLLLMYKTAACNSQKMMQVLLLSDKMLRKWIGSEEEEAVTQEAILAAPVVSAVTITTTTSNKNVVTEVQL